MNKYTLFYEQNVNKKAWAILGKMVKIGWGKFPMKKFGNLSIFWNSVRGLGLRTAQKKKARAFPLLYLYSWTIKV